MEIKKSSEAEVTNAASVDAEADWARMAEVVEAPMRAGVVLVERSTGQDFLSVDGETLVADNATKQATQIGMFGVQLPGEFVAS
jgi:hypothetical protein